MTIDELAEIVNKGFSNVQSQVSGLNKRIDDLELMTGNGFNDVQNQINDLAFDHREFRKESNERFSKLEKDMGWVKEVLEAHTKILKDLDEEKIFMIHRTDRIENDVNLLKKRLKIA